MTQRCDAYRAMLRVQPTEAARVNAGIQTLEALYGDLIHASMPANRHFEFERIVSSLPSRREIVFMLGLLTEGENETALLLELIDRVLVDDPTAATSHMLNEASYYLRTSIDEAWQLEERPLAAEAATAYLLIVLEERLERLRRLPKRTMQAAEPEKKQLLQTLQAEFLS